MGRIRTIKPEFHAHEELSALPPETHLLAAALLNYADDAGYFNANLVLLKAGTTPLRNDKTKIEEQLAQLEAMGYVKVLRNGLKCIGHVCNFLDHQRVSNPTPSKLIAKFEELRKSSVGIREELRPEGKGREQGTGNREGASAVFVFPDWLDPGAWKGFLDMRVKIRKPITEHGKSLLVAELDKLRKSGNDPTAVLNQSTMNSWQGLFELKGGSNGTNRQSLGNAVADRANDSLARAKANLLRRASAFDDGSSFGDVPEPRPVDGPGSNRVVLEGVV